jgi:hypothetical protein
LRIKKKRMKSVKELKSRNVTRNALYKGNSYYSFIILFIMVMFISVVIHVVFFIESDWMALYLTIFPGLPIICYITSRIYYQFYLFEDFILIRHPFKLKNRTEVILLSNVKYFEFLNNLRGPNIIVIHPKRGMIKTNRLQFHDLLNRKVFVF